MAPQVDDIETTERPRSFGHPPDPDEDRRNVPEVYLSHNKRRGSFGSNLSQIFLPETSDIPTQILNDVFAKFRPVSAKKHVQKVQQEDDAALFAYLERRGSAHQAYGRLDSSATSASRSSISSSFTDELIDDERKPRRSSLSALLSTIKLNFVQDVEKETPFQAAVNKCPSKKGNAVYRFGRNAADLGQWEKAVHCYHIALAKQRSYYGEDHLKTAETLNALGLALIELEEHFGAITALEECLHIRQKLLGPGAEECAVTTNNISRVLDLYQRQNGAS